MQALHVTLGEHSSSMKEAKAEAAEARSDRSKIGKALLVTPHAISRCTTVHSPFVSRPYSLTMALLACCFPMRCICLVYGCSKMVWVVAGEAGVS